MCVINKGNILFLCVLIEINLYTNGVPLSIGSFAYMLYAYESLINIKPLYNEHLS